MSNNKQSIVEDLAFWKNNAEENYITTPISVLKYITELEKHIEIIKAQLPSDEEISTSLCYYDLRNADGISQFKEDKEHYGLNDDDFKDLGNFAKKDCGCDNCFYGKHKLANYILKIQGGNK